MLIHLVVRFQQKQTRCRKCNSIAHRSTSLEWMHSHCRIAWQKKGQTICFHAWRCAAGDAVFCLACPCFDMHGYSDSTLCTMCAQAKMKLQKLAFSCGAIERTPRNPSGKGNISRNTFSTAKISQSFIFLRTARKSNTPSKSQASDLRQSQQKWESHTDTRLTDTRARFLEQLK